MPGAPKRTLRNSHAWGGWIFLMAFLAVMYLLAREASQSPNYNQQRVVYSPNPVFQGGYENPAPGNDGSYDCPPGGGRVWVGDFDPAGLDGDGDGWGCE